MQQVIVPFFFNKPFRLSADEKAMFLACADKATASLKRNQKRDSLLGPVSYLRLLGGLATYAFLLRHIAAGRRVRYFAPFHPAGCMAAFLGHAEVLRIFERHGVPLESLTWSWHNDAGRVKALVKAGFRVNQRIWEDASPLHMAIRYGRDEIARFLLRHGAVNRDLSGRVQRVEPWMIGMRKPASP